MTARPCAGCAGSLPVRARAGTRYCSTRCRVAAHRAGAGAPIPDELRALPRWVRRSAGKVPLTCAGRAASSTDPRTWSPYAEAKASSAGVGLGFVLNGDGVIVLDLDHCLSPAGELLRGPAGLIERLPPTWIERSPSGDGLHVWLRGVLPRSGRLRFFGQPCEGYSWGRFVTVTGDRWRDAPLALAEF